MTDSHVDRDRHCGTHSDHVPHPWDYGRRHCQGWGKYAADRLIAAGSEEPCPGRYVGPTGVVWVCIGTVHPSDPDRGNAGSGHTWRAAHPAQ